MMSSRGRCASCSEPIGAGGAICARGRLYHLNHFCCEICAYPIAFNEQGFVLSDGKLACMRCFRKLAPKCHKCKEAIISDFINYSGNKFHKDCFKCSRCHVPLASGFYEDNSRRPLDRDCLWGQLLMDHIVKDVDNAVPTDY
uniref:Transforming growth factor beta-1-induced transcript 1 protein n=1 Tax=Ascaris suum TaxID=6253 RepID=F1LAZ3_ASCSU